MGPMSAEAPVAPMRVRRPISLRQVERVISRSVAVFGIVFAAQSVPWLLPQLDEAQPQWLWLVVPAITLSLLLCLVLSFAGRLVRASHALVSIVYFVALLTWPAAILPGAEIFTGPHWLYYLITVATATAAIAFPPVLATAYLVIAPSVYLVIRATPAGGSATALGATLEAVYALILGGAVMIIVVMLRFAARTVDAAQETALQRYAHAVRHHAIEAERARVDSIVHDSVLTTLLSAARAETPDARRLAATMAGNAIGYVREAAESSPGDEGAVRLTALVDRISDAADGLAIAPELRVSAIGTRSIPAEAAEAVFTASVQALINSKQHAGEDADRWLAITGRDGGVEVVVGDTGTGFELDEVPAERMGVRVSIVERLASVGGHARIDTAPGNGTVVSLRWPEEVPA